MPSTPRSVFPLSLKPGQVIPTGNEWISLPSVRAEDAALESFNVLFLGARGLLEAAGPAGVPLLKPFVREAGKDLALKNFTWDLLGYWIPRGTCRGDGLEVTVTYLAPPDAKGALIRVQAHNRRQKKAELDLGLDVAWNSLNRVTYAPRPLDGKIVQGKAPWVSDCAAFFFNTYDTMFCWCLRYPEGSFHPGRGPAQAGGSFQKRVVLEPGQSAEAVFYLGIGVEEFSASQATKNLSSRADRAGLDGLLEESVQWCMARTHATGREDLDQVMNRNFLFNLLYSWGRALDTEALVSVTSRSPRYYVSAAYWDRDAMLWSFPGVLDVDPVMAREALEHALGPQLRNTGIHSRFIDGTVLEGGFQLDEAAAPFLALAAYVQKTGDLKFLKSKAAALDFLKDLLCSRLDPATGLITTFEDSQDEYIKQPFNTYSMVISWKALLEGAYLYGKLKQAGTAKYLKKTADRLHAAILKHCVVKGAPGASGTVFARATDLKKHLFNDVPPGSLMKLPLFGFIKESDPAFVRTYQWLHSRDYQYSNHGKAYGLPGSWRVASTCCWSVADHLRLKAGHAQAMKVLGKASWDGGIVSEMLDPDTAEGLQGGGGFATAAGYVAHAIYEKFVEKKW